MKSLVQIGEIELELNRKPIKHLHVSVLPPNGKVRVSAPEHMTDTAIRRAVVSRIPWIKKQQSDFKKQPRQPSREMVSGESHFLWGKSYRLDLVERNGRHEIKLGSNNRIQLYVNAATSVENKLLVLNEFYRSELKERIAKLLEYWLPVIGVQPSDWGIKKMKTRWGSCNTESKRIWLNLELAKKLPECLEYILVHELIHLLERKHNDRFKGFLDKYLPDWRERRDLLNKSPLAFVEWKY